MSIFHEFIESRKNGDDIILQPRMGFSDISEMRNGLNAVHALGGNIIGTITLDSYTRTGQFDKAKRAIELGHLLNGYPMCTYNDPENRRLIAGIYNPEFPVQVRHGSPLPMQIIKKVLAAGLDATEGGPISYCLPYGRTPLELSIKEWREGSIVFTDSGNNFNHIESFGGCMLGQICPPSLLIVITILEGIFFQDNGVRSLSLSFSQGSNSQQDEGAIIALKRHAKEYLNNTAWHIVIYTFMGKFPESLSGAKKIIQDSARLAEKTMCSRLIVKTASEARHIPAIVSNIEAIRWCQEVMGMSGWEIGETSHHFADVIYEEAKALLDTILNLAPSIGGCIKQAFIKGMLDVPYCLHPDNKGKTSAWIDEEGVIRWGMIGKIPIPKETLKETTDLSHSISSSELLTMLNYNQLKYDSMVEEA